jgi:hypothetical protein
MALALMTLLAGSALAQTGGGYDLTWSTVDGGGVTFATGSGYKVGGTIGQADAGKLSGGGYFVTGGFWWAAPTSCPASSTPMDDPLPAPVDTGHGTKNRYVSFTAADVQRQQAIRVTFVDLPGEYADWIGTQMWVGEPAVYCENAGQDVPPEGGCGASPGMEREFSAATLHCTPVYRDWNADGAMHVFHEGLIPGGIYDVQVIDEACATTAESSYSPALPVMMSGWGDVVENCAVIPCLPPDGSVDVTTDVTAILDKFKNSLNALVTARADIEPQVPDQKINISDVTFALDAFRGRSYPPGSFPPPSPLPCQ